MNRCVMRRRCGCSSSSHNSTRRLEQHQHPAHEPDHDREERRALSFAEEELAEVAGVAWELDLVDVSRRIPRKGDPRVLGDASCEECREQIAADRVADTRTWHWIGGRCDEVDSYRHECGADPKRKKWPRVESSCD